MFSVEEYKIALSQPLTKTQLQMLRLNYAAPDSAITALQMSRGMGWQNRGAANMHYGKLGRLFAERIGHEIEPWIDGSVAPLLVLADFHGSNDVEWLMWENLCIALEELQIVSSEENLFPEDVTTNDILIEGLTYTTTVNAFERNPNARKICIEFYGFCCVICNFDFEKIYGETMYQFIHVHHLRPLSEIREEYIINPIEDLRPVCPNCHAVIHSKRPAYTIKEVKAMLNRGQL
jgi:5-methylcytosine-specific restriction enzyme A